GVAEAATGSTGGRYNRKGHRQGAHCRGPTASAGRNIPSTHLMKINKEIRRLSREMLRASFTDGQLDPGRIASLVDSLIARKPRNSVEILQNYRRLLRLELEKRRARVETACGVDPETSSKLIANLKQTYRNDLTYDVNVK